MERGQIITRKVVPLIQKLSLQMECICLSINTIKHRFAIIVKWPREANRGIKRGETNEKVLVVAPLVLYMSLSENVRIYNQDGIRYSDQEVLTRRSLLDIRL